jgi:hypothetical protein
LKTLSTCYAASRSPPKTKLTNDDEMMKVYLLAEVTDLTQLKPDDQTEQSARRPRRASPELALTVAPRPPAY